MRVRVFGAGLTTALAAVVVGCAGPPAYTPPPTTHSVDQSNLMTGTTPEFGQLVNSSSPAAQTFTASRSGQLDQVSLLVQTSGPLGLDVSIESVTGGHPSDVVLGSGSYAGPAGALSTTMIDIPLTVAVPVVAGTQYAIVVAPAVPAGIWSFLGSGGTATDHYVGGEAFAGGTGWTAESGPAGPPFFGNGVVDFYFQTWVL